MTRGTPDDRSTPPSWPAPPGTEHRYCDGCLHWFASRGTDRCVTCISVAQRAAKKRPTPGTPFHETGSTGRRHGVRDP